MKYLVLFLVFTLLTSFCFADSIPNVYYSDMQAKLASPVQSVNGLTGNPVLPVYQRQVSSAIAVSTTDGTVSWTFPSAFSSTPSCFYSLASSSTTYTFDYPALTAISANSVSIQVSAHPKSISILSLSLPIVLSITPAGPPAGTTITFSCLAPM